MPDSGTLSKVPCANELEIDLEMGTSDELDVEKRDLFQLVNFICNADHSGLKINEPALNMTCLFDQLQTLQLDGERATGELLLQIIANNVASFAALKTIIWDNYMSPLNELLPLWGLPAEHIEVSVGEPVAQSLKRWPAPTHSLKKLNLYYSTIAISTVKKLLRLSPCLELFRYDHLMDVINRRTWQDCSLLMAALQQVRPTLRELDLSITLYSGCGDHDVDCFNISPVKGQLGPLQKFSHLRKLKAPIVTLLGWSPGKLPLRLAEVLPAGLTHLGLTEDLLAQYSYEWDDELVLEEMDAFLGVWRSVTPDLQAVEVWICRAFNRWKDAEVEQLRMMCEKAGVLCTVHEQREHSCFAMGFQWVRQPQPRPIRKLLP